MSKNMLRKNILYITHIYNIYLHNLKQLDDILCKCFPFIKLSVLLLYNLKIYIHILISIFFLK